MRVMHDYEATYVRRLAATAAVNAAVPIVPARDLAMAPAQFIAASGCLGIFFGIAAAGAFVAYRAAGSSADAIGSNSTTREAEVLLAIGVVAGLLFAFCIFRLFVGLRRRSSISVGKPAAEAVWHQGRYCYRCTVVYFQAGETPPGVAPGQPLTPAQFQHIVWSAGGYGRSS
jgi:hypothetical protein